MKPKHKTNKKENILFLKELRDYLNQGRVVSADFEAEMIVRYFGKMDRVELFAGERKLSMPVQKKIWRIAKQRIRKKPLQYLLGEADFFGHRFFVNRDVLIPRPETELLVEEGIRLLEGRVSPRVLDVGTGSGCIAVSLTLARVDCRMTALDISSRALAVAGKNSALHGVSRKIQFLKSDLFDVFGAKKKDFWDLIVSNPPYIPKKDFPRLSREVLAEPRAALEGGGPRGLGVIFSILEQAPFFLKKQGWLLMEIGQGQAPLIAKKISEEKIFSNFKFVKDYNHIDRILAAQNG
jgi:release factor glutamine methyltransferase